VENREQDRVTWRKHWIRLLGRIALPSLALLIAFAAFVVYLALPGSKAAALVTVLFLLLFAAGFWWWWNWEDWGNDLYIVTNDRIIDTKRLPLGFGYERTETTFDRIQNVRFEIPHVVATFFDYGTVFVYTAGAEGRLDFEWIQHPSAVQAEIFRRLGAYEDRQRQSKRSERWDDLSEWFSVYEKVRG
jgi:hypothetical protein